MIRIPLVVLALALLVLPATAQEEAAAPTPAENFRAAVDARAVPSEKDAFRIEGEIFLGDRKLGTFRFTAEVVGEGEEARWRVEDHAKMSFGPSELVATAFGTLDRRLGARSGENVQTQDGTVKKATWKRTDAGYEITERVGDAAPETQAVETTGDLVMGGPSFAILLARGLPAEAAEYEFRSLNFFDEDGETTETALLRATGAGEWEGKPALLFSRQDGEREISIALDPETREFLGMKMEEPGAMRFDFRVGDVGEAAETAPADPYTPPARSAKQCALIAALAYGTGDGDLLSSVCDWPSIVKDLTARYPGQDVTEEALRENVVTNLNNYPGKQPRETVAPVLQLMSPQLKIEGEGDRVKVVFPPAFQNLVIPVERFGDEWRVVSLPGT